jgi:DNA (cytosine-5)-methyltransferase 1
MPSARSREDKLVEAGWRVVDLFCGAGGLSEGFRQAGLGIVAGADHDPDACATFAANFPEARVISGDIRDGAVQKELLAASAGADIVVGGPPCQAFSQVRNHARLIDDPRNSLYREFVRIVGKLKPPAFLMENVPGLEQMGVKEQVLDDLGLRGAYRVAAQVVDAADFGVPQTRQRILFLGIHSSLGIDPPTLCGTGATSTLSLGRKRSKARVRYDVVDRGDLFGLAARLGNPRDADLVTAEQAIGDLAGLAPGRRDDAISCADLPPASSRYQRLMRSGRGGTLSNVSVPRINADTKLRLAGLPPGGNYRDLPEAMLERYLTGERWGPDNGSGRLGRRHYYAYRRLHPGFWSWTLNTKADSVYHYSALRALSVREFARLQSFPDRFVFVTDARRGDLPGRIEGGAAHSRYRQAGNAVPPLLARAVALHLAQALAGPHRSHLTA